MYFTYFIKDITLVLDVFDQKINASLAAGLFIRLTERGNGLVTFTLQSFVLLLFEKK